MVSFNSDGLNKYVEASGLGAFRGALGLVIEHPLDTVKTRCQANLGGGSPLEVFKQTFKEGGIKPFYSGAFPNGLRVALKQAYRYPMMLGLPPFFEQALPDSLQTAFPSIVKTAAGITIAGFETFLCPLERLKVYLMTAEKGEKRIRRFFSQNQNQLFSELTRGLNAVFARQVTSWVSFLVTEDKFKNWERKRTNTTQLSFFSLIKVSFCVGCANTLVNMPFDTVKTNLQKKNFIANEGVLKTMLKIVKTHGMRGLYAGASVRLFQYMIQSAVTVTLLDSLESSWKTK